MESGVGMFGDLHINSKGEVQPAQKRMQELIEEIKLMDEVGLTFPAWANTIGQTIQS